MHGFLDSDSVSIVSVGDICVSTNRIQLPPIPGKGLTVIIGQRITDGIIGNRIPIIGSEQVFPSAVTVGIIGRYTIDRLGEDVSAVIVGVRVG